jgi:hypothetical protein
VRLIHDTLITVGLLALLGREFNLVVVAALLTLVGYSVNDTGRGLRPDPRKPRTPKKEALESVINRSINQTLSRTVLTSGATMLVVVALFALGGEVLNTFALTLIIGIIIGTTPRSTSRRRSSSSGRTFSRGRPRESGARSRGAAPPEPLPAPRPAAARAAEPAVRERKKKKKGNR